MIRRVIVAVVLVGGALAATPSAATPSSRACWGQASAVFAQLGMMGEHASGFETPRLGLRNLARALHTAGILPDDTMQALGAFVADELDLSIAPCS
jgi:hypothetical protein